MSAPVLLRRAGESDAQALAALERAASLHPWSEAQLRDELVRAAPDAVLLLEDARGIRAYCALRVVIDELHVMNLAVEAQARRQGLARVLVSRALVLGARAGARRALLEVRASNHAARSLYAKSGFRPIGERKGYYSDPPDDALVLARDLAPDAS